MEQEKPESTPGGATYRNAEEEDLDEEAAIENAEELEEEARKGTIGTTTSPYNDGEDELTVERAGNHKPKSEHRHGKSGAGEPSGAHEHLGFDQMGKNTDGSVGPVDEGCFEEYKRNEERLKGKMERGEPGM